MTSFTGLATLGSHSNLLVVEDENCRGRILTLLMDWVSISTRCGSRRRSLLAGSRQSGWGGAVGRRGAPSLRVGCHVVCRLATHSAVGTFVAACAGGTTQAVATPAVILDSAALTGLLFFAFTYLSSLSASQFVGCSAGRLLGFLLSGFSGWYGSPDTGPGVFERATAVAATPQTLASMAGG